MTELPVIVRYSIMGISHLVWYATLTIVISFSHAIWQPGESQADSPGEYQVKGAFLYHFATFVDWPSSSFNDTNGQFLICIMGKDPFGKHLDSTLREKKIHAYPLEIHRNPRKATLRHCHMLYITASQSSKLNIYLQQYGNANVLTVGENDTFLQNGGMIKFYIENQKVRFAINPKAISTTNLKVSSKLLRLAKIISP